MVSVIRNPCTVILRKPDGSVYVWRFWKDQAKDVVQSARMMLRSKELCLDKEDFALILRAVKSTVEGSNT